MKDCLSHCRKPTSLHRSHSLRNYNSIWVKFLLQSRLCEQCKFNQEYTIKLFWSADAAKLTFWALVGAFLAILDTYAPAPWQRRPGITPGRSIPGTHNANRMHSSCLCPFQTPTHNRFLKNGVDHTHLCTIVSGVLEGRYCWALVSLFQSFAP